MVAPAIGLVVLVQFPFSDLSDVKLRPAVVIADATRGDWVLRQIKSKPYADIAAVELGGKEVASGGLATTSYARPAKLFCANQRIMSASPGRLTDNATRRVNEAAIELLKAGIP
jgi:mRNA interferase MazF